MKLKHILLFSLLALLALPSFSQTEMEGVSLKSEITMDGQKLVYNGAGVRKKYFFKLYVGALYLPQKLSSGSMIVKGDQPMLIQLNIISDLITSEKMIESVNEGFEKSTGGNTSPIQTEIDQIIATFKDEIKDGDVFNLMYLPGTGVKVYKNGTLGATVKGMEFKKALFGIWLGDDPVASGLKDGMLGK